MEHPNVTIKTVAGLHHVYIDGERAGTTNTDPIAFAARYLLGVTGNLDGFMLIDDQPIRISEAVKRLVEWNRPRRRNF